MQGSLNKELYLLFRTFIHGGGCITTCSTKTWLLFIDNFKWGKPMSRVHRDPQTVHYITKRLIPKHRWVHVLQFLQSNFYGFINHFHLTHSLRIIRSSSESVNVVLPQELIKTASKLSTIIAAHSSWHWIFADHMLVEKLCQRIRTFIGQCGGYHKLVKYINAHYCYGLSSTARWQDNQVNAPDIKRLPSFIPWGQRLMPNVLCPFPFAGNTLPTIQRTIKPHTSPKVPLFQAHVHFVSMKMAEWVKLFQDVKPICNSRDTPRPLLTPNK